MELDKLFVAASLLIMAAPSWGEPDSGKRQPTCKDDITKFCASVMEKGGEGVETCLKDHAKELSKDCKEQQAAHERNNPANAPMQVSPAELAARQAQDHAIDQSCAKEKTAFCAGVEQKDGALVRCLQKRKKDANKDCKKALDDPKPSAPAKSPKGNTP